MDSRPTKDHEKPKRVHFRPGTKLGKWAAWLLVAVLVVGVLYRLDLPPHSSYLAYTTRIAGINGVLTLSAFVIGLIAIIRSKERAVSVYLAIGLGAILLVVSILGAIIG
jgi:hypothetical protein